MKLLINGKICDGQHAMLSVYDHGFLYGMGLFETFRTYNGRPFLLEEHLHRLRSSCEQLGIRWDSSTQSVEQHIQQLLEVNNLEDAYIRYTVSAGIEALGLPADDYLQPNTIMYMKELPLGGVWDDPAKTERALQRLQTRRNTPEGLERLKSFHFMNNILAKRELQTYAWAQQAEGLFLSENGHLAEGIVSNLFFIRNKQLFTPDLKTGILAGITRAHVLDLAMRFGFETEEGFYYWEDLLQADEVFITNSIQEITPIVQLFDEQGRKWPVGTGRIGEQTLQIIQAYRTSAGGKL